MGWGTGNVGRRQELSNWGHHCRCPLLMEMTWGLSNSWTDWMKRLASQFGCIDYLLVRYQCENNRVTAIIMMKKRRGHKAYRLSNNTHVINGLYDQYLLWAVSLQAGQFDYCTPEVEGDHYPELHSLSIKHLIPRTDDNDWRKWVALQCNNCTLQQNSSAINFNKAPLRLKQFTKRNVFLWLDIK